MSNELVPLYSTSVEEYYNEDYESEFRELINKIISGWRDIKSDKQYKEQKEVIINVYNSLFKECIKEGDVPDFESIVDEVRDYNLEAITNLALLDLSMGNMCPTYSHREYIEDFTPDGDYSDQEESDWMYQALFDSWFEDWEYEIFNLAIPFIYDVLSEDKVAFTINKGGGNFYRHISNLADDVTACMYDAQNLLIPEWHIVLITGEYVDAGDSYESEDIALNLRVYSDK